MENRRAATASLAASAILDLHPLSSLFSVTPRLFPFPGAAIVQFVIAGTAGKLAWSFGPSFVAAAKLGGALVKAILVGTAMTRHFVSVAHDARKQLGYLIQALLILFLVNLRHVGPAPCKMRFDWQQ